MHVNSLFVQGRGNIGRRWGHRTGSVAMTANWSSFIAEGGGRRTSSKMWLGARRKVVVVISRCLCCRARSVSLTSVAWIRHLKWITLRNPKYRWSFQLLNLVSNIILITSLVLRIDLYVLTNRATGSVICLWRDNKTTPGQTERVDCSPHRGGSFVSPGLSGDALLFSLP